MAAYYNEIDRYAAFWLRNLIARNLIAPGDVDERSIADVRTDDLRGYRQCHFFAGIAGWSYALRLAGWDDDRSVWTGSCPCQPFSHAGQGKAADDERHLWPKWFPLIAECHPATIFGEQVEAAIGRGWLDLVFADLEAEGYACASAVLPACSVGAPHIRQRLWFVADANGGDASAERLQRGGKHGQRAQDGCAGERLGNTFGARLQEQRRDGRVSPGAGETDARQAAERTNPWSDPEWLSCTDGKARPTKPGILPLAYGVSSRMGKLRAAGNAIVPQVAAEFIGVCMECQP